MTKSFFLNIIRSTIKTKSLYNSTFYPFITTKMKKNLLKVGALALSVFAAGVVMNASNAQETGDLTLTINAGTSECVYATSLDLGSQAIQLDTAYEFSGDFAGNWTCTDYDANTGGWDFYVTVTDLTNASSNVIESGQVDIMHTAAVVKGDTTCAGGTATAWRTIVNEEGSQYILMTRTAEAPETAGVCEVWIDTVSLKVDVPANQAPGAYTATLTMTLPNF